MDAIRPTDDVQQDAEPSSRSPAWTTFERNLSAVLAVLQEDQFLVVSLKRAHGFVQFAAQGSFGLRAETTSNHYRPEKEILDDEQLAMLNGIGWLAPTGSPDEATPDKQPEGSPNFFQDFEQPVGYDEVARLASSTFVQVLRVPHPGFLNYEAFDADGRCILLPTLGLALSRPVPAPAPRAPDGPEQIREVVLTTIREATGNDEIGFDKDGDVPVRFGSAVVFVRVVEDPLFVRIFSPVLARVEGTDALLRRLNDLNAELSFARLTFVDGTVMAAVDVSASPITAQHLAQACAILGKVADDIDDLLQTEFGGRTAFGEFRPPPRGRRRVDLGKRFEEANSPQRQVWYLTNHER